VATATAMAVTMGCLAACGIPGDTPSMSPGAGPSPEKLAEQSAQDFFDKYVERTGRVVRRDQGGDTVSEGQAYGLLLAVALGDQQRFDRVWTWTKNHLQRDDGLFSWRWRNGAVADEQPAADADLDIARALVLAGKEFDSPKLGKYAARVAKSILREETAVVHGQRVLLPGPWADQAAPLMVNVSYVSPVATQLLAKATGDRRWQSLEAGSRAVVEKASREGLPPDWAILQPDGSLEPSSQGPGGKPGFGWDAVRVPIRHAESCVEEDRTLAGNLASRLESDDSDVLKHPVGWVARAASYAAADRPRDATRALATADDLGKDSPTYYGDAWDALGRYLLIDDRLGGCPPEGQ
jgi:endoglucanase